MIVLCSPDARKSQYVNDEIRHFAQERGRENIIPVLVFGVPNNEAKLEQEEEKAFPETLCEMMDMPLAASYIGFDPGKEKGEQGGLLRCRYKILADLYDISRSEIEERDKKHRRNTRIIAGIITASIFLTISYFAIRAWNKSVEADEQGNKAKLMRQMHYGKGQRQYGKGT